MKQVFGTDGAFVKKLLGKHFIFAHRKPVIGRKREYV
jgi:hypothetical protein